FKPERVPPNLDVIVIGSGPSGLSSAFLLAKAGKKVLVLEQHDTAGGSLHTFVDHGYEFDSGHHISIDVGENSLAGLCLKVLLDGKVEFSQSSTFYPVGGTSKMVYHASKNVRDAGAEILVRAKVVKIITQGERAIGVTVQKGSTTTDVFAPIIISSAEWYREAKPFMNKPTGYYQLFVGLNKTAEELELPWQPIRCFATNKECGEVFNDYLSLSLEEALEVDIPLLIFNFGSAKDSTFNQRHP
ncbi:unnamed protein product, partial [Notodromas monacha]